MNRDVIPPFNDDGYLPPGIHSATLDEITERFGSKSEMRRVQMESIHWLMDLASRANVKRIVLNGSFVTEEYEPNDVDCVLLVEWDQPPDTELELELKDGLPFLDIHVVQAAEFDLLTRQYFAQDREKLSKGLIEVIP